MQTQAFPSALARCSVTGVASAQAVTHTHTLTYVHSPTWKHLCATTLPGAGAQHTSPFVSVRQRERCASTCKPGPPTTLKRDTTVHVCITQLCANISQEPSDVLNRFSAMAPSSVLMASLQSLKDGSQQSLHSHFSSSSKKVLNRFSTVSQQFLNSSSTCSQQFIKMFSTIFQHSLNSFSTMSLTSLSAMAPSSLSAMAPCSL